MTRPWLEPLPEAAAQGTRLDVAAAIPVIETDRLTLRAPRLEDWTILEPIWTTDRARYIGGPFNGEDAWLDFNQAIAGWLFRGIGGMTITDRDSGAVLGLAGFFFDYGDSELELGWLLTEAAEGHGIAFEAATALREYGFGALGPTEFVSFVNVENTRSVALAERLGAQRDAEPRVDADGGLTFVFRHRQEDQK